MCLWLFKLELALLEHAVTRIRAKRVAFSGLQLQAVQLVAWFGRGLFQWVMRDSQDLEVIGAVRDMAEWYAHGYKQLRAQTGR